MEINSDFIEIISPHVNLNGIKNYPKSNPELQNITPLISPNHSSKYRETEKYKFICDNLDEIVEEIQRLCPDENVLKLESIPQVQVPVYEAPSIMKTISEMFSNKPKPFFEKSLEEELDQITDISYKGLLDPITMTLNDDYWGTELRIRSNTFFDNISEPVTLYFHIKPETTEKREKGVIVFEPKLTDYEPIEVKIIYNKHIETLEFQGWNHMIKGNDDCGDPDLDIYNTFNLKARTKSGLVKLNNHRVHGKVCDYPYKNLNDCLASYKRHGIPMTKRVFFNQFNYRIEYPNK